MLIKLLIYHINIDVHIYIYTHTHMYMYIYIYTCICQIFFIGLGGGGGGEKHCTRASLHSDTVEDLIRISVEGSSLEDVDARETVACWLSQGQKSRRTNYRSWPSEGHVDCNGG